MKQQQQCRKKGWITKTECDLLFAQCIFHMLTKVIYTKYSKHWLYTVAHTIECVCSKMNNSWFNPWFSFYFSSLCPALGCPKYSKNLIFASLRTFRILRISDLNIFKLRISWFASLRFELRISRISRIYSENCS